MANISENQKAQVFNVVILDRSGSMAAIRTAAIDGFNETLAGIKNAQERFPDTQEHFVSLVTFCGCGVATVFDKVRVADAKPLTADDYKPCCLTPLCDAIGFTITSMREYVKDNDKAVVIVTIITDGLENASKEFDSSSIKKMIEPLRSEGWTFTYMGANQDSESIARTLSIRNFRNFDFNPIGTMDTMRKDSKARTRIFIKLDNMVHSDSRLSKFSSRFENIANEAFDATEED